MERAVEGDISRMETHTHTHTHPPTHMEGMGDAGGGAGHCIVEETVGMQLEQATSRTTHSLPQCDRHHNTGDAARQQWLSKGEGSSGWLGLKREAASG